MPDLPRNALTLAEDVVAGHLQAAGIKTPPGLVPALARAALDAAAPVLATAVAEKILAHMEAHSPPQGGTSRAYVYRSHFATAAQVAGYAFTTEAEMKRQAAEALAAGNYVACPSPEDHDE